MTKGGSPEQLSSELVWTTVKFQTGKARSASLGQWGLSIIKQDGISQELKLGLFLALCHLRARPDGIWEGFQIGPFFEIID